ncbi:hypothetical protein CANINC_004009, partial [Pichia inconspicua]
MIGLWDWNSFKQKFSEAFCLISNETQYIDDFRILGLKLKPGQPVAEYFAEFNNLKKLLTYKEGSRICVYRFLFGLTEELREYVMVFKPTTIDSDIKLAQEAIQAVKPSKKLCKPVDNSKNTSTYLSSPPSPVTDPVEVSSFQFDDQDEPVLGYILKMDLIPQQVKPSYAMHWSMVLIREEIRSFYVLDTDQDLLILGLPFVKKYAHLISLIDLVEADLDDFKNFNSVKIQVNVFDYNGRYVNKMVKKALKMNLSLV